MIYFSPPPLFMPAYDSETWFAFCGFNCILGQLPERETWWTYYFFHCIEKLLLFPSLSRMSTY